jgi:hypothetical protein
MGTDGIAFFGEGEVPPEPRHCCVLRFTLGFNHGWAWILRSGGLDETTEDTEYTEGEQRVCFLGRAKFHLSRRIPVFRDSRFFNHGWAQMGTD